MQVVADRVAIDGPYGPLLPETSLAVSAGELAVVHGEPGPGSTAFAMVLTGRLRPDTGTVTVDDSSDVDALRTAGAVVDAPGVNAPDDSSRLGSVVAEELSFAGQDARRDAVAMWLAGRNSEQHAATRLGQLEADLRTRVLADLAATRPGVRLLVLDRPDRFTSEVDGWWMLAYEHAERGLAVIVLTATTPLSVLPGPVSRVGRLDQPAPHRCTPHGSSGVFA